MEANQAFEFYMTLDEHTRMTTFGPHMHAPGVRFCIEAIYGGRSETLSCAGYDHNWIRAYPVRGTRRAAAAERGPSCAAPGTSTTRRPIPNVVDPRNWTGFGHPLDRQHAAPHRPAITLTEEEFRAEVAARRERLGLAAGETVIGLPAVRRQPLPDGRPAQDQDQQ